MTEEELVQVEAGSAVYIISCVFVLHCMTCTTSTFEEGCGELQYMETAGYHPLFPVVKRTAAVLMWFEE